MNPYNPFSLTHFAATIADVCAVERPKQAQPPLDWAVALLKAYCKDGFDRVFLHNADAVGMWLCKAYPQLLEPVRKHTLLTIPFQAVMPSVTPVCFGSMYTGANPEIHGIQKYEKPVIQIDTLFDAFIRAGKRVAIVSTQTASMSNIFLQRPVDIYNCPSEGAIVEKAQELILQDTYDLLCVYTYMYDTMDHRHGPQAPESIAALANQGQIFDSLVSTIERNWTGHNTLIGFAPDHGVHSTPEDSNLLGNHGTDSPLDLNILHYFGVVCGKNMGSKF
jgi:hypothetical protein